jgi:Restriction endonuclease
MARRQKQTLEGLIGPVLIAGAVWLLFKNARGVVSIGGTALGLAALACAFILVSFGLFLLIRKWLAVCKEKRVRLSLLRKVHRATQEHLATLARMRMQYVQPDAYGNQRMEKWTKEIRYFLFNHLGPSLSSEEQAILNEDFEVIKLTIDDNVKNALHDDPSFRAFPADMSPGEFESFCAEELRRAGWNARVTPRSRDQGVDVIADKDNLRVVIQCKLYNSGPVGNKAVQEAAAGKAHERANYGIVVSNSRYTSAAKQLAATNDILLLHFTELRNLDVLLPTPAINNVPPLAVRKRRFPNSMQR